MLAHHLIRSAARNSPGAAAISAKGRTLSFQDIDALSDEAASLLREAGVGTGDRVAAQLENGVEYVVALWATWKSGGVFVPVNYAAKAASTAQVLKDCGAALFVAARAQAARNADVLSRLNVQPVFVEVDPAAQPEALIAALRAAPKGMTAPVQRTPIDEDLALLIYTSGSTGEPKGVMLTHRTVVNNATVIADYLEARSNDVVLCVLPMTFGYGLFQALSAAVVGAHVVLEQSFAFPAELLKRIAEYNVTGMPGVPSLFARLLDLKATAEANLSSLRYLTNAAAPLSPAHVQRLQALIPNARFYSMYGLTECTRAAFMPPERLAQKPGSVGRAIPNCELFVADEEGRRLPPGEIGELIVRGANLMRGYWGKPDATAKAFHIDQQTQERLLRTGDLFYEDADGDLFFVGRADDMFKCRGERVAPRLVEDALHALPGVLQAAVIGVDDEADGKAVKAFVVPSPRAELDVNALRKACQRVLEPWLVPKFIEICAELPQTDSGKVTRAKLREAERVH